MGLKLFKIWQDKRNGYSDDDFFDSAVVVAKDEEAARMTHPGEYENWDGKETEYCDWVNSEDVHVDFLGEASIYLLPGVVVASFNAS